MPRFPPKEHQEISLPHRESAQDEKSPESQETDSANRIRIKNRRKRYLDLHPEYFQESHLELADPLLYDRLIRRFQSAAEREIEGRSRGYAGSLEANLVRSEAKLQALENPDPHSPLVYTRTADGSITGIEQDEDDRPAGKDEGRRKWEEVMELRFLRGGDGDFDYETVDGNEDYDDREEDDRKDLEYYLQGEQEEFLGKGKPAGETGIQDF